MSAARFFKNATLVGGLLAEVIVFPTFLYMKNKKEYAELKKNHPNAVIISGRKSIYGFTVWGPTVDVAATREIERQKIIAMIKKTNISLRRQR